MNKILIVDDSATMRKILMRVLRLADYHTEVILEAANGVEGLERLVSDPDIQLILSSIDLPEMNGVEFVRAVRTKRGKDEMPVVMITTEAGEEMLKAAIENGANGYVTMPFTPEGIRRTLEKVVG